jgi:hypothetical protein
MGTGLGEDLKKTGRDPRGVASLEEERLFRQIAERYAEAQGQSLRAEAEALEAGGAPMAQEAGGARLDDATRRKVRAFRARRALLRAAPALAAAAACAALALASPLRGVLFRGDGAGGAATQQAEVALAKPEAESAGQPAAGAGGGVGAAGAPTEAAAAPTEAAAASTEAAAAEAAIDGAGAAAEFAGTTGATGTGAVNGAVAAEAADAATTAVAAPAEAGIAAETATAAGAGAREAQGPALIPLGFSPSGGFAVLESMEDDGKSVYVISDAQKDDVVAVLSRGGAVDREGLAPIPIGGGEAYGAYHADYSLLTFEKGGVVYVLTCRYDINTLIRLCQECVFV